MIPYIKDEPKLGDGKYGIVYKRIYKEKPFAVKRIQIPDLNPNREKEAMKNLDHENVIKLIDQHEDEYFKYIILVQKLTKV